MFQHCEMAVIEKHFDEWKSLPWFLEPIRYAATNCYQFRVE